MIRLAITPGEPAGIGPDLCVQLAQTKREFEAVVFADPDLLLQRAQELNLPLSIRLFNPEILSTPNAIGELTVSPVALTTHAKATQLNPDNAHYVLETLRRATQSCTQQHCAALVTGPVHKGIINDAGIAFSGHTEFLAELTGGYPVMMLAASKNQCHPNLRVALATTHLPLKDVSKAITPKVLKHVIRNLNHDLKKRFGIASPSILVCGLNPHAGEGGHLGKEEIETIIPTLQTLTKEGIKLTGPLPADTLFTPRYLDDADAVVAMFHDQGLPVLKYMGFGRAVNITLGLPIIRTSVDHGTALDLAGTGKAEIGSLETAIQEALTMAVSAT